MQPDPGVAGAATKLRFRLHFELWLNETFSCTCTNLQNKLGVSCLLYLEMGLTTSVRVRICFGVTY